MQEQAEEIDYVSRDLELKLQERQLRTMWDVHEDWSEPRTTADPYVWKWEDVLATIEQIEEEVAYEDLPQGIRRSLALTNPANPRVIPSPFISVFFQTVTPGEDAGAHRHNVNAFRFVVDGSEDSYTIVEGEAFPMTDNSLITTPNWTYHDHVNESDERTVWIDVLDWPLVGETLNTPIFEDHSQFRQPIDKAGGYYNSQFGRLRPLGDAGEEFQDVPPYRFSWEEAYESLTYAAENNHEQVHDPYNGVCLEYVNPETGEGPTLSTTSLRLQLFEEGEESATHRHNTSEIYHVVSGSGETEVGDTTLEWAERDTFVVPPGEWHSHAARDEETLLFVISDQPIFDAFNFYNEETPE